MLIPLLVEHTAAWNSHDINRLMAMFGDDCVFEASAGPDVCGARHVGRTDVEAAFVAVFDSMPDCHWGDSRHYVLADGYGLSEWRLTGTRTDGTRVDVLGCDFITVEQGKIVRKSSFRKQQG